MFNIADGTTRIIHEGRGVYHGVFPAVPGKTVWVVSRPHNWRPSDTKECLLLIDIVSGDILHEHVLETKFTHDAARRGDRVYVANTDEGALAELEYPGLKPLRMLKLFTPRQHVNTLHISEDGGTVWAMLHNKGPSKLVAIDLATEKITREITGAST